MRALLFVFAVLCGCGPVGASATCADRAPYLACGCGCCGGTTPVEHCVEPGASICDVIADDQATAEAPGCAMAGCSQGVVYRYCEG